MAVRRGFRRQLTAYFWAWFREMLWPAIQAELVALITGLVHELRQWAQEWLSRSSRRQEEARDGFERADKAAKEADAGGDTAEANTQRRVAEVWRSVADSLREENEALKHELQDLMSHADQLAGKVEQGVQLRLSAGDNLSLLPASNPLHCSKCGADLLNEQSAV